jgi:hypothetical protein
MSYIVGDHAILNKGSYRTGRKNYLVKIIKIGKVTETIQINDTINYRTECTVQTVCNADTGKKYKTTLEWNLERLESLEEFLDNKRALIKDLEGFLI